MSLLSSIKKIFCGAPPLVGTDASDEDAQDKLPYHLGHVVATPPFYYPQGEDLNFKLEQCLERHLITSFVHVDVNDEYFLEMEFPCSNNEAKDDAKFNLFNSVMEKQYKLHKIDERKLGNRRLYQVIFVYKPLSKGTE